jgi:hydrogenase maturation protease
MKPPLLVGLGNPLAGDDGVGWHVAERVRSDPRRPDDIEVLQATDILRIQDALEDRTRLIIVDALLDDGPWGRVLRFDDLDDLDTRSGSVHHLPPAQALMLLRCLYPAIRDVPITFLGVTVRDIRMGPGLSSALDTALSDVVGTVLAVLAVLAAPAELARPREG